MLEFSELIIPAFIAGLFTFLAPCTFPLVPVYLSFIGGGKNPDDINKSKAFTNTIFFSLGFSIVFILLGIFAGFLGENLGPNYRKTVTQIGGLIIIFFGLNLIGVIKLENLFGSLNVQSKVSKASSKLKPGKPFSSFILGVLLSFAWSPCIGPVLGSILTLAINSTTAVQGGILLAIFSLGLSIPFLAISLMIDRSTNIITKHGYLMKYFKLVSGTVLIIFGLLMVFNQFNTIMEYGYELFSILGLNSILELL